MTALAAMGDINGLLQAKLGIDPSMPPTVDSSESIKGARSETKA